LCGCRRDFRAFWCSSPRFVGDLGCERKLRPGGGHFCSTRPWLGRCQTASQCPPRQSPPLSQTQLSLAGHWPPAPLVQHLSCDRTVFTSLLPAVHTTAFVVDTLDQSHVGTGIVSKTFRSRVFDKHPKSGRDFELYFTTRRFFNFFASCGHHVSHSLSRSLSLSPALALARSMRPFCQKKQNERGSSRPTG
jgi:hypothetical protein